jgi:hypothetical protein
MDRKIRSKAGQVIYALRKTIAEPVFGQIKGARGLDRFLLRGLEKVDGEWTLMVITHNISKLHRASLAASCRRDHRSGLLRPGADSSAQNSQQGAGKGDAAPSEMCDTLLAPSPVYWLSVTTGDGYDLCSVWW